MASYSCRREKSSVINPIDIFGGHLITPVDMLGSPISPFTVYVIRQRAI